MNAKALITDIKNGKYDELLLDVYVDEKRIPYQKQRYEQAIEKYIANFGDDEIEIYSAPGRSEVGGNHTDHQHGEILAASINNDAIAVVKALSNDDIDGFLKLVKESGNSSYKYLQNVYSNGDVQHQNVSLALSLSELFLGENGVCRVHGGGFAGTIQAFVKNEAVAGYQEKMNQVFGEGACSVLKVRKYGGTKVL